MKRLALMFTKAHKSMTLAVNWIFTVIGIGLVAALEYFPMLKGEIDQEWFVGGMILLSVANKMIRVKTTKPLEER